MRWPRRRRGDRRCRGRLRVPRRASAREAVRRLAVRLGGPSSTWLDDVPATRPPAASMRPSGKAAAARRDVAAGSVPTRRTTRLGVAVGRRTVAGSRSSPSGFDRNPEAADGTPKWPYCQTIRFVRGSITTILWCQSSVIAIIPFGQRTAREGRSSEPGPDDGPYVHTTRPLGVIMSTRPGVLKPATRMLPLGRSCASDGYVVGVRTEKTRRPRRSKRSTQPPISVTSIPPSCSGVAPFGDERVRGGSCAQLPPPPISATMRCAGLSRSTRQFLMSATVIVRLGQTYASSGFESSPPADPATPARP